MQSGAVVGIDEITKWSEAPVDSVETETGENIGCFFCFFLFSCPISQGVATRESSFIVDAELNERVSIWKGDLLSLEVDGVLNATSEQFSDRTVQGKRIAQLAGPELTVAISRLEGCRTGEAKITPGYNLNARYIIHTVGPRYNARYKTAAENALHSCYRVSVQVSLIHVLKTN